MLVKEIIYSVLGPLFNDCVGPHPLPQGFDTNQTYVTYQGISGNPLNTVKGWTGHTHQRVQINIFHSDIIDCEKAKNRVIWAMDQQAYSSCVVVDERDEGLDEETQVYQQQVDFLIWQEVEKE